MLEHQMKSAEIWKEQREREGSEEAKKVNKLQITDY